MRRILVFLLLCAAIPSAAGSRDSLSRAASVETFRPCRLAVPAAVFTAGAVGVNWNWYAENINIPIKDYASGLRSQWGGTKVDNYIQYIPVVSYVALGACGLGEYSFMEQLAVCACAYATMGALTNALKYTVCEMRPDGSARNSFPSGHSATAFMGAELVRLEFGNWIGAGAYAIATATALLRVYNCRHWFGDLLGGAGIGILSARVGYWLLPLERRVLNGVFGTDLALAPFVGTVPATGLSAGSPSASYPAACGLSCSLRF